MVSGELNNMEFGDGNEGENKHLLCSSREHCSDLFKELVGKMSMCLKDKIMQDIFYSMLAGGGMVELSGKYNLSRKALIFMYEKAMREVSDSWEDIIQGKQKLQLADLRYRNCKTVLSRNNFICEETIVAVPVKECDIPVEYLETLSTPLSNFGISPRILRNLRKYNIYLLEDLLRFIKRNGFDGIGRLHGVGARSCDQLFVILKDKSVLEDKDTCYLFRYIFV